MKLRVLDSSPIIAEKIAPALGRMEYSVGARGVPGPAHPDTGPPRI
jgi:hypothetical protein